MPRQAPDKPGPGRPKGSQNKLTIDIKEMILGALDKAGGMEYLYEQAQKNPGAFMTLLGKVLPTQINADVQGGFVIQISKEDAKV
jgi:hypothetical protein